MKNIFFCAIAILNVALAQAQSKDRDVIASTGGYVSTPTVQMSFTIGETATQYLSSAGTSISQGFQQSNENTTGIRNLNKVNATLNVYPNPFIENIEVKSDKKLSHPSFSMIDATGRSIQITSTEIENGKRWRIAIGNVAVGNYWLTITSEGYVNTIALTHTTP